MKIILLTLFLTYLQMSESAIKCYKCKLTKPSMYSNETIRLCSEFDYSEKFIINCPYSTFCMKKTFSAKIPIQINATERDCADQKYVTQKLNNGTWQSEIIIEEPYKEGCLDINDKGLRTSKTQHCYCKSDLCNFSQIKQIFPFFHLLMAVIIFYLNFN